VSSVTVVDHPVLTHRVTQLRDRHTSSDTFRQLVSEVSGLLAYEALRDLGTTEVTVDTPVAAAAPARRVAEVVLLVPILRAGLGMAEGVLRLLPDARLGHLGVYRDEKTLEPVSYYQKLPPDIAATEVLLIDPMLATGGSALAAVHVLKNSGVTSLKFVCLVAAPEGIAALHRQYPEVPIFCAAVDRQLNEKGYILPGLGDAGDRLFGT